MEGTWLGIRGEAKGNKPGRKKTSITVFKHGLERVESPVAVQEAGKEETE